MSKAKDHTGVRYGRAVGIRPTALRESKQIVWEWQCDCGEVFLRVAGGFVYGKYSPGCEKCVASESAKRLSKQKTTHGMSKTKEYRAWRKIKERVFCPTNPDFPVYSILGMEEALSDSFENFYAEIGPCPNDNYRWSVGRIDNSIGYRVGNIRWETDNQQARNKGKSTKNTTGHTGVVFEDGKGGPRFRAQWKYLNGKHGQKSFNINKYGEELALLCAVEARDQAIRLLNQQGAGYSPNHGK